jgi:hypothetical protein
MARQLPALARQLERKYPGTKCDRCEIEGGGADGFSVILSGAMSAVLSAAPAGLVDTYIRQGSAQNCLRSPVRG